jgi:hypothetical protein
LGKMCWLQRGVRWRLTCASIWQLWFFFSKSVPVIFKPPCNTLGNLLHVTLTTEAASSSEIVVIYQTRGSISRKQSFSFQSAKDSANVLYDDSFPRL